MLAETKGPQALGTGSTRKGSEPLLMPDAASKASGEGLGLLRAGVATETPGSGTLQADTLGGMWILSTCVGQELSGHSSEVLEPGEEL